MLDNEMYIELSLRNLFEAENMGVVSTSEISNHFPSDAKWIRSTSQITLQKHVSSVKDFLIDAQDIGWCLPLIKLNQINIDNISLRNAQNIIDYNEGCFRQIMQYPYIEAAGRPLVVIGPNKISCESAVVQLKNVKNKLFPNSKRFLLDYTTKTTLESIHTNSLSLIILPDSVDVEESPQWLNYFHDIEKKGMLFKPIKQSTIENYYAWHNIIFDLFMIDGGIPWIGNNITEENIVAIDAGHDTLNRESLWVATSYCTRSNNIRLSTHKTSLNESFDDTTIKALQIENYGKNTCLWRDGKFHKSDRESLHKCGFKEENLYSFIKEPQAVMFRGNIDNPQPPKFGDALRYPDGSVLLQTIETKSDYRRPIRVKTPKDSMVADIIALCKQPITGFMHPNRLPAPLYWADLVSKKEKGGWLKVVGRSWNLKDIIPRL
jgi:hypothetical protein